MSDLLSSVLKAHGGSERWRKFTTAAVTVLAGGEVLDRKTESGRDPLRFTISLREQSIWAMSVPGTNRRISFKPTRVAIETTNGDVIAERVEPRASFVGHDLNTKWDALQRAYFGSYAMWTYFNSPFMFTMPGVRTEEISPIEHNDETWRCLRVTLPTNLVSHSSVQKFYFGSDYFLRRHDYTFDIGGGGNVANYAHELKSFDGIVVATKRRAYLCDDNSNVLRDRLLIWLDFSDIEFR
jgi:hypothetical protein